MGADCWFYVKTIKTHNRAFLTLNILAIGVSGVHLVMFYAFRDHVMIFYIKLVFLGGTKNGTDSDEMATRIYHQNFAPRIAPFDADEREHEIGSASRRKCFLKK